MKRATMARLSSITFGVLLIALGARAEQAEIVDLEAYFGVRFESGEFGSAKFSEYRDEQPGAFGGGRFLLEFDEGREFAWGSLHDVGEDDQAYKFEAGRWNWFRIRGDYQETPHVFNVNGRSPYMRRGSQLFVPASFDRVGLQAAPSSTAASALLESELSTNLHSVDIDLQYRRAGLGLRVTPTSSIEFDTQFRIFDREGTRPLSMVFGSPGGHFVNFASPVDERTRQFQADLRFFRDTWNLELGYLGSFFENAVRSVTIDNPLSAVDASGASAQGRISRAPDNSAHTVRLAGAKDFATGFPARVSANLSYGIRKQNDGFLAHTINTAFTNDPVRAPDLVLPRHNLDGSVHTLNGNVLLTASPVSNVKIKGRYRIYRYDNRTDALVFAAQVAGEDGFSSGVRRSVPNDYTRQRADFDAAWRVLPQLTVRGGPFWERWHRSRDREVTDLDEYGGKFALDWRPESWALVRADYRIGVRSGTRYDPYDFLRATLDPADVAGEIPQGQISTLRKFDEADRTLNQVRLTTQVLPRDDLDITFSGGFARRDYDESRFGLRDDERFDLSTTLGYQPTDWLSFSSWYSFEHIRYRQNSRYRTVAGGIVIDDPVNDWNSTSTDLVHAGGVSAEVAVIPERVEFLISYTIQVGQGRSEASGAAGATSATSDGGNAVDWPNLNDTLHVLSASIRYHVADWLTLEPFYTYERFKLDDFRIDGLTPFEASSNVNGSGTISASRDIFLSDGFGDYDVHIAGMLASVHF